MWEDIEQAIKEYKKCVEEYKNYNKDYAKKEYLYRTALSKKLVELRASGEKVTHLADIARGIPEIAKLRFDRDISEGLKKSAEEGINFYKHDIRVLEGQLNREWSSGKITIL